MRLNNICCIGCDYLGGPFCSIVALNCPEIRVTVLDNKKIIKKWNSDNLPFLENDLFLIIKKCRNRNLFFSSEYATGIKEADLIFISINSPLKSRGAGEGKIVDLKQIEEAARLIALHGESDKIVVEKSTIPGRAVERISLTLKSVGQPGVRYQVLSNPEFTAEGSPIYDMLNPERVLIGCQDNPSGRAAAESLSSLYEHWVPRKSIVIINTKSAELTKLASASFLAQITSSVNSLAEICDESNAEFLDISKVFSKDSRLGSKYSASTRSFGSFHKELLNLIYICENLRLKETADYWQAILDLNCYQMRKYLNKIADTSTNRNFTIWGFANKKNTSDTKNSPAIEVCQWLMAEYASIKIYDPKVPKNQIKKCLGLSHTDRSSNVVVCNDLLESCDKADVIIVCTDWDEFHKVDPAKVVCCMRKLLIIDGRTFLEEESWKSAGFEFHSVPLC